MQAILSLTPYDFRPSKKNLSNDFRRLRNSCRFQTPHPPDRAHNVSIASARKAFAMFKRSGGDAIERGALGCERRWPGPQGHAPQGRRPSRHSRSAAASAQPLRCATPSSRGVREVGREKRSGLSPGNGDRGFEPPWPARRRPTGHGREKPPGSMPLPSTIAGDAGCCVSFDDR